MFNWLWEKLGGGKSTKKDEETDDTTGDVATQQPNNGTDEAAAIAAEAAKAVGDSKKGKGKARPKKANATRAKPSRQASASLSTSSNHELPPKTKKGSTTSTGRQRRGSGGGSISDFDIQYPKLLAFFDKEGHWNVPIAYKNDKGGDGAQLFAFSQSLRQHMRKVEEWETEQKKKYSTSKSACLLYTSPSPRDLSTSRMPSSA